MFERVDPKAAMPIDRQITEQIRRRDGTQVGGEVTTATALEMKADASLRGSVFPES
jgi:hypothetical protein